MEIPAFLQAASSMPLLEVPFAFELDEIHLPAERRFDAAMRCRFL